MNLKKKRLLNIPIIFLLVFNQSPKIYACFVPGAASSIKGKNVVCLGEQVTYSVDTISLASSYKWTFPSGTQIISGANTNTITVALFTVGGIIKVQGINTCDTGISQTLSVKLNGLPKITIIAPKKYCCDYGSISLGSSNFASPTGGTWTCRQNTNLISSNAFNTAQACDNKKGSLYSLYYTYQDPNTTCVNTDSTFFTINPLPALLAKNGSFCQNIKELALKSLVVAPTNLNLMEEVNWRLLKTLPKKGGGNNTIYDLVYDAAPGLNIDYWLKLDTGTIDLGSKLYDSLILEISIKDYNGCYNRDTITIKVMKVPDIYLSTLPELCLNSGLLNLSQLSNAKPDKGCWRVFNKTGYSDSVNLVKAMVSCDTLNTLKLSPQNGPGLYLLRYTVTSGACANVKEAALQIHELPKVSISLSPNNDGNFYCETEGDVMLNASPAGGNWSSPVAGIVIGSLFKPNLLAPEQRDKWITLSYSYAHPTTKCDTVKNLKVFVQSKPRIKILTQDIDTCRSDTMLILLKASYSFTSKITWVHSEDPLRAGFENKQQISNKNPAVFTLRPQKDSISTVSITAFTEAEGVCPFAQGNITIRIDTIPCKGGSAKVGTQPRELVFDVYLNPNPNRGIFTMEIKREGPYRVKLYSVTGELKLEINMRGNMPETVNERLSSGIYFLNIEDETGFSTRNRMLVE